MRTCVGIAGQGLIAVGLAVTLGLAMDSAAAVDRRSDPLAQADIPRDEPPSLPSNAGELPRTAPPAIQRIGGRSGTEPVRVGIIGRSPIAPFLERLAPFRDGLARALGRPVEIQPFATYAALVDAQVSNRVQLGLHSSASFAVAEAACACLEPLVAPAAEDGTLAFHGILVARRDAAKDGLDGLRGGHLVAGGPDSIGASRLPLAALAAEGIDPSFFGRIESVHSPVEAMRMVLDGRADAALGWSTMTGDAAAGYSRGSLALLARLQEGAAGELAVLWRSPPLTHGPVAASTSLPEADRQSARGYFLDLAAADPETYGRIEPFYPGGYRAVGPDDYRSAALLAGGDGGKTGIPAQ
ncbi:phosphate/phosphite/phosphonate ABC transporter substrate-binding protein [Faunimonas sp. B44]|uniref:phosphate/phosphite/phosphonate ABC transporter substrate-binding protein n=1 Tax=Faunimonas sp. B44 TaxID=3461493 RepID=UPI0040445D4D